MKYKNSWVISKEDVLKQNLRFLITKHRYTKEKNKLNTIHNHILNEIEFVTDGCAEHIINGHKYECIPGSIYLMSQLDVHQFIMDEPIEVYSICFTDDFLPYEIMENFKVSKSPYYAKLNGDDFIEIKNKFDKIIEENKYDYLCKDIIIKNAISEIVIEILRNCEETNNVKKQSQRTARAALAYIRENFKEDISLASTASHLGITASHLSRMFKNNLDITFNDYLKGLRLDYAMRLINVTSQGITEICLKSGFNSPAHFSKIFKERFGVSPTSIRKKK